MELAQYIIDAAKNILAREGDSDLPKALAGTDFYLAKFGDLTIIAHGMVRYKDVEYKIGPKRER
jgi:hypothetical protein